MKKRLLLPCTLLYLFLLFGCSNDDNGMIEHDPNSEENIDEEQTSDEEETEETTDEEIEVGCGVEPNPEDLINGDQLAIVAGKLLSYAVSTEDECAYTPPGKWINIYGTVYYRYVERANGLSVEGLIKESAEATASILTSEQLHLIVELVADQTSKEIQGLANRDIISRELYKWKSGNEGSEELILRLTYENGHLLKDIIEQRTQVYGEIIKQLTNTQKNNLCSARVSQFNGVDPDDLNTIKKQLETDEEKAVLNIILAKFFSWATGTVSMNKLVDDGRPAVYFGFANLRVEDREGEDVSSGLRGEASKFILSILTPTQLEALHNLVSDQRTYLEYYFESRGNLASLLMDYQSNTGSADPHELSSICVNSEIAESQLGITQAKKMGNIIQSLNNDQMQILVDFKNGN